MNLHSVSLPQLQMEYKHSDQNLQPDLFLKIGSGSIQAWRYE